MKIKILKSRSGNCEYTYFADGVAVGQFLDGPYKGSVGIPMEHASADFLLSLHDDVEQTYPEVK